MRLLSYKDCRFYNFERLPISFNTKERLVLSQNFPQKIATSFTQRLHFLFIWKIAKSFFYKEKAIYEIKIAESFKYKEVAIYNWKNRSFFIFERYCNLSWKKNASDFKHIERIWLWNFLCNTGYVFSNFSSFKPHIRNRIDFTA